MHRLISRVCFVSVFATSVWRMAAAAETPKNVTERFLNAWGNKDSAGLQALLDEHIEISFPDSKRLRGREQVLAPLLELTNKKVQLPKLGRDRMISPNVVIEHLEPNWDHAPNEIVPVNVTLSYHDHSWHVVVIQFAEANAVDRWNATGFLGYPVNISGRTRFIGAIGKLSGRVVAV